MTVRLGTMFTASCLETKMDAYCCPDILASLNCVLGTRASCHITEKVLESSWELGPGILLESSSAFLSWKFIGLCFGVLKFAPVCDDHLHEHSKGHSPCALNHSLLEHNLSHPPVPQLSQCSSVYRVHFGSGSLPKSFKKNVHTVAPTLY